MGESAVLQALVAELQGLQGCKDVKRLKTGA